METKNRRDSFYFYSILILGTLFSLLYSINMIIDPDVGQMLYKGCQFALHDILTPYGNASSAGMGHLPGYISTLVIGLPMKIWHGPLAPLLFLLMLHGVALWMVLQVIKRSYSAFTIILYLLFFWLSPWRTSETFLWNPSFLIFATALHFWSASKLINQRSFLFTFLHFFSIYFAFQLHNSSLVLFLMTVFLYFRQMIRVNYWALTLFGGLAILSFVPYIQYVMAHPEIAPVIRESDAFYGRGLLYIFPLIKGLSYWVRYSTMLLPRHIFYHMEFSWIALSWLASGVKGIWIVTKFASVFITLTVSLWANFRFFKKYLPDIKKIRFSGESPKDWIHQYSVICFLGVFVSAALSPIDLIHWHILLVLPIAILTFVESVQEIEKIKPFLNYQTILIFMLYFSFYNLLGSFGSLKHSINYNLQEEYQKQFIHENSCKGSPL